ncbi:hypothetical protein JCM10449v2_003501 [Rhodotorula kratochvilovae]
MELNIAGGAALKQFTRALTCLSRIGDDLDFSATQQRLSISTVNSSRTAFGIAHFYPRFFAEFLLADPAADRPYKFSITARARLSSSHTRFATNPPSRPQPFLSTLRTKSTVESVSIAVLESEGGGADRHREPGVDSGECRLVVHLFCEHGVRKKHSLTYSDPNVQNWARFDLDACTSSWTASSRVLKDWTDHFHLRPGSNGAADEITFYCGESACRLKSFNDSGFDVTANPSEKFASRPLATELTVDVGDFDAYDVPEPEVVTFALKDFKSIITLADSLPTALTAHFSSGGRPLMLQLQGDYFEAKFVVATTDYDSGGSAVGSRAGSAAAAAAAGGVKREKSESLPARAVPPPAAPRGNGNARASGSGSGAPPRPLFNAPTPSPAPQLAAAFDDDDFGGGMDDDDGNALFGDMDAAFAEIDRLSQAHPAMSQLSQARVLVSDTTQSFDEREGGRTQMGPTQAPSRGGSMAASQEGSGSTSAEETREREAKRARWNLMGDY